MNPIIAAVDEGHVTEYRPTRFTGGKPTHLIPSDCKKDGQTWPCEVIRQARAANFKQARHQEALC